MDLGIHGKKALVCGASAGLGYACAQALVQEGAHVVIVARTEAPLLAAAEQHARARGCCKLTLEVLTGNARALKSYLGFGFEPYALDPAAGQASFMQKWL